MAVSLTVRRPLPEWRGLENPKSGNREAGNGGPAESAPPKTLPRRPLQHVLRLGLKLGLRLLVLLSRAVR